MLLNGIVKGVKETCRRSIYGSVDKAGAHRVLLIWVLKELWLLNEDGDLHLTAYSLHTARLVLVFVVLLFSCSVMANSFVTPIDCSSPGSSVHGIFPDKNNGVGYHFLLQGIFPT